MKDTRIAVVISNARVGHTSQNLAQIADRVQTAAKEGASLVCFPEMCITGYHIAPFIRDCAEPLPGPAFRQLQTLSKTSGIGILAGMAERDASGSVHATHLFLQPGGVSGKYRKTHLGPPEQAVFKAGGEVPVFDSESLRLGIQLCYDAHFPELSTTMALKGAEAIFIPHASPGGTPEAKLDSWMRHLPARAFDNGVFIIACNQTGDNGAGLSFPGVGLVLGPSGSVLASYTGGQAHMMLVDLKSADLSAVRKHRMRYFLPHRRPELYACTNDPRDLG